MPPRGESSGFQRHIQSLNSEGCKGILSHVEFVLLLGGSMPSLSMNLVKRIERLPKPKNAADAMQPLFEAVSNSIHSTREKYGSKVISKGRITVTIETARKKTSVPIKAYVVDNGVGLDRKNFTAFQETDTDNKLAVGGKGVGRLLWLDCFEKIKVKSHYKDGRSIKLRSFDFHLSQTDQIKNLRNAKLSVAAETGMWITFEGLRRNEYLKKFPGRPSYIFQHITSHFLPTFIGGRSPQVIVHCGAETRNFPSDISDIIFRRTDAKNVKSEFGSLSVTLMECDKVASADLKGTHFVHFIAHDRTVHSQPIDALLGFKYFGLEGRSTFHACVFGKFLDDNVNQERTNFIFEESIIEEIVNDVCMPQIQKFLAAPLGEHRKKQGKIVSDIVSTYPSIAFGDLKELQKYIPLGELKEDAIYGHLSRQRFRRDEKQAEKIKSVLAKVRGGNLSGDAFFSAIKEASEFIEGAEQKSLAEYVVRRKVVLDFLDILIQKVRIDTADSSYQREDLLHAFICPLKVSTLKGKSDQIVPVSSHNLWIVDERLTFAKYFSSDMSFVESAKEFKEKDRADVLIFDRVHGLRQSSQPSKVLLVEFKRPGRKNYADDENPHEQVERYIKILLDGGCLDVQGRPIHIKPDTIFYCFIVADRVGRMKDWTFSWSPTADGRGRIYLPRDGFRGSVELIEWDTLIDDARERNSAFFDQAGISGKSMFSDEP